MDPAKKTQIEKRIIITLLVILGVSILYTRARIAVRFGPAAAREAEPVLDVKEARGKLDKFAKREITYHGPSFRNPIKKPLEISILEAQGAYPVGAGEMPGHARPEQEEFVLEGIIWGGKENLAIISGQVVSEGETVNAARVLRIYETSVTLTKAGKQIELKR